MQNQHSDKNQMTQLYAITDPQLMPHETLFTGVEAALIGSCKFVQYRDKLNKAEQRLINATRLLTLCSRYQANLIINDDMHLAHYLKVQGVHLGQDDGDVKAARKLLGEKAIIGVTCHDSLALAKKAINEGASYIAFGRFFLSHTKPHTRSAPLNLLEEARNQFPSTMIVAIGGITIENAKSVLNSGANMVAVCQSLFAAKDITAVARAFNAMKSSVANESV